MIINNIFSYYYISTASDINLLFLPIILGEKSRFIFDNIQDDYNEPYILVNDNRNFSLFIEKELVYSSCSFIIIFTCFYCSFYIYNIAYTKQLNNTMVFIQKCIFDQQDEFPIPVKVKKLYNKISN